MKIDSQYWHTSSTRRLRTASENLASERSDDEDPLTKRLRDMQEGLHRLQAMPSPQETARQRASARVEMLKRQIEQLRSLLIGATPQMAKALVRQIASLAGELANIAKQLGGGSASGGAASSAVAVPQGAGESQSVAAESAAAEAAAADEQEPTATPAPAPSVAAQSGDEGGSDKQLRTSLEEAAKRLKALIELLKARLRDGNRQQQDDLRQAEKAMHDLDETLNGSQLYSSLATSVGAALSGVAAKAAVAVNIDVQA